MRAAVALTLAVSLACVATPAIAQDVKPGTGAVRETDKASRTRSVTGTVKTRTDNGLVVMGREAGQTNDKEWAFALEPGTKIESAGKPQVVSALREGDAVTVTYTDLEGKVVARNIKVSAK